MGPELVSLIAAVATWLVTELTKSKACRKAWDKIPRRAKRLVPVVLGAAAAGVNHATAGGTLKDAAGIAVSAILGSVGIHELVVKGLLGRQR